MGVTLPDEDLRLLAQLSKAINKSAYHGGLGMTESGKYIGLLDRIIRAHDTDVETLVPFKPDPNLGPMGVTPRSSWKP